MYIYSIFNYILIVNYIPFILFIYIFHDFIGITKYFFLNYCINDI